ncbi:hypothetical protein V1478_013865 [Vespula squamosa]|uniref:Uncharacterized protein n=1 Tax=Vespula squamosa TaxID=30214 RepID=A0ABD2A6D9_VESSQ
MRFSIVDYGKKRKNKKWKKRVPFRKTLPKKKPPNDVSCIGMISASLGYSFSNGLELGLATV